jgi:replication-associated recombination protein RarA
MLWVDKHRPLSLDKMDYAKEQAQQLTRLAGSGDMPHLLFYGPSGAGKKTRVMALLRAMFGSSVEKVRPWTWLGAWLQRILPHMPPLAPCPPHSHPPPPSP